MSRYSLIPSLLFAFLGASLFASSVYAQQQQADVVIPIVGTGVSGIDFSSDGAKIAVAAGRRVRIYDVVSGEEVLALADSAQLIVDEVSYSPDGKYLLTIRADGETKIFDAVTGEFLRKLLSPPEGPYSWNLSSAVWSPDGSVLYTADAFDSVVHVWDTESWQFIRNLEGHAAQVTSLSLSADGTRLLSTDEDGYTMLWNVQTWEPIHRLVVDTARNSPTTATYGALSPDGRVIATTKLAQTDPTWVRLWDAETGESIGALRTPLTNMYELQFSPDGTYLLGCSNSKAGYIWRMSDRERLFTLSGHTKRVNVVTFSPDGVNVATGSDDGTVRVWSPDYPASVQDRGVAGGVLPRVDLYPNPALDVLHLSFILQKPMSVGIELADLMGRNVGFAQEHVLPEGSQIVDISLSDLSPAYYYVIITTEEGVVRIPVIVL